MDAKQIEAIKARLRDKLEIADRKGIRLGQYGNQASSMGGHLHDDIRALLDRVKALEEALRDIAKQAGEYPKCPTDYAQGVWDGENYCVEIARAALDGAKGDGDA